MYDYGANKPVNFSVVFPQKAPSIEKSFKASIGE